MIPNITTYTPEVLEELQVVRQPSLGWGVDFENNKIIGLIDELEAVKQAIYLILSTERYAEVIHSWNYGFEKLDIMGENPYLVTPKLQGRVFDAVYQDDRVTNISNFDVSNTKGVYTISFDVSTIYGDTSIKAEVIL